MGSDKEFSQELEHNLGFLHQMLEMMPVGMQVFDKSGVTSYINQRQADILGIPDKSMPIGKFNVLTDPFSVDNGSAVFYEKVYNEKKASFRTLEVDFNRTENNWKTRNGKRILHETVFPILGDDGNIERVVAVLSDKTDESESFSELLNREKRFRSIFENAISGIVFTDKNGIVILANKAFERISGYSLEELKNKAFAEITYEEDRDKELELIRCALESRSDNCRMEKRYVKKDGKLVWVDVSIAVIRDEDDAPLNYVAILKDIDKKKQAETELSRASEFNQMIINISPVGIVVTDGAGQIIMANEKAEGLLGLLKDDIEQRSYNSPEWKITDFEGNPFPDEELPFIQVREKKKTVESIKHAIEWPDGKRRFLSINATPQLDGNNNFIGMVASLEDITNKVQTENKIKENNAFLNAIVANAAEGLCVCHNCADYPFVEFTVWNSEMTKVTGYTMEEINKLGWYQTLYLDEEIRNKAMNRMANMRQGDNIAGEEWTITRKDKQERVVSIATSIISTIGEEVHVMALMNDVTEKQKAKKALEEANEKLKKVNDSKDRFFAILAHDLKSPLASAIQVHNMLSEYLTGGSDEQTEKLIDHLGISINRCFKLLEELLEWSRAQTHKIDFNPGPVKIMDLIGSVIDNISGLSDAKGVKIQKSGNPECVVDADVNMIQTVLRNLLGNAIKYSISGDTVEVQVKQNKNSVDVSVVDIGVGIPQEKLKDLFQIDKNVSTLGTNNEKGTGLGLLLCKELIDYHKGKIWATSNIGKGSSFNFSLISLK